MKKLTAFVLAVICILALCSCVGNETSSDGTAVYFIAKVTEAGEKHLMTEVTDPGTTALTEGTPVHVSTDFDGYTGCETGTTVRVEFDGMIQELYPPIIPNVFSIEKAG